MPDLIVAGAGMAGLSVAAEARRLGADPLVVEKLPRPGGSMRLSSGVIWRHRDFDRFRDECPRGDERLQRLLFERLDADLEWLESLGAPVVERDTGNPLTIGTRFDTAGLTDALVEAAGGFLNGGSREAAVHGPRAAGGEAGGVVLEDPLGDAPSRSPRRAGGSNTTARPTG
jgi:phytoene dehydrogenase-like protein